MVERPAQSSAAAWIVVALLTVVTAVGVGILIRFAPIKPPGVTSTSGNEVVATTVAMPADAGVLATLDDAAGNGLTRALHAAAFSLLDDETIYSRLDILENQIRSRDADETIVFADNSLRLRGEYYDIDEKILRVQEKEAQGHVERVGTSLGKLVLTAPLAGMVVYKKNWRGSTVSVGDSLWPGNVIMSIVDSDVLTRCSPHIRLWISIIRFNRATAYSGLSVFVETSSVLLLLFL